MEFEYLEKWELEIERKEWFIRELDREFKEWFRKIKINKSRNKWENELNWE
jgi:hypothetical protein